MKILNCACFYIQKKKPNNFCKDLVLRKKTEQLSFYKYFFISKYFFDKGTEL